MKGRENTEPIAHGILLGEAVVQFEPMDLDNFKLMRADGPTLCGIK